MRDASHSTHKSESSANVIYNKNNHTDCKLIAPTRCAVWRVKNRRKYFHVDEQEYKWWTGTKRGSVRRKLREKDGYNFILGPNVV